MTTYTTQEAEARFGEILRKVRMGERVVLVQESLVSGLFAVYRP